MSDPLSRDQLAELRDLIFALHDRSIATEDSVRLEEWICRDEEACRVYVQYMHLCARLYWDKRQEPGFGPGSPRGASQAGRLPILGFLADAFEAGTGFLSGGLVISLVLMIGLPVVLLVVLLVGVGRQSTSVPVAAVTRMHECVWSEDSSAWCPGTDVYADQRLELRKGLAEITFARGAKVLLEGPATLTVADGGQGYLRDGSLVATVEKGAEGFMIQTPALAIVDFGTEFGVSVEDERGTGNVEVFQGKVELRATAKEDPKNTFRQSLTVGQVARVEVAATDTALPTVRRIAPTGGKFVRQMPAENAIVADFSGGVGNTRSDQFPGAAGSGWAAGWRVGQAKGMNCTTTVDEAKPVLGGGRYLHVVVQRKQDGSDASAATVVERRLDLASRPYAKMPNVVSFNLRIDDLKRFGEAGDRLSICSRSMSKVEFDREGLPSSGWHVCAVGKGNKYGKPGNWVFLYRDAEGRSAGKDSGIPVREGETYSFRMLVDPVAGQWTPSMAVNAGQWKSFAPMGMRSKGTTEENEFWPFLHFHYRSEGGKAADNSEGVGFSVDSIRVVPQGTGQTL